MPSWIPLNWELMKNPANWVIVVLMVAIAAILFCIIFGAAGGHASAVSTSGGSNS